MAGGQRDVRSKLLAGVVEGAGENPRMNASRRSQIGGVDDEGGIADGLNVKREPPGARFRRGGIVSPNARERWGEGSFVPGVICDSSELAISSGDSAMLSHGAPLSPMMANPKSRAATIRSRTLGLPVASSTVVLEIVGV